VSKISRALLLIAGVRFYHSKVYALSPILFYRNHGLVVCVGFEPALNDPADRAVLRRGSGRRRGAPSEVVGNLGRQVVV